MDNKDLINLFFQVLTLMGTMAAGFFSFWKFASGKIDTHFQNLRIEFDNHKTQNKQSIDNVYRRMDEKVKDCVPDILYQLELKHQKENVDQRLTALMEFLKLRLDQLDKTIEKLVKHDENNQNGTKS